MSSFINNDMTTAGLSVLAKGMVGNLIKYTRIVLGDGYMPPDTLPRGMTKVVNEVISLDITKCRVIGDGTVVVGASFTNISLIDGFFYRELGLYAEDPSLGEILYCYGNAGDFAEWIPPGGKMTLVEKVVDVITVVGTATNITANIKSGIYITTDDLKYHETDPNAHNTKVYEPIPDDIPDTGDTFAGKGFLNILLNRITGLLKHITGKSYWWQKPAMNIEEITTQLNNKANTPIEIPGSEAINLNNYTTPGMYFRRSGSQSYVINGPVAQGQTFALFVEKTGRGDSSGNGEDGTIQTLKSYDGTAHTRVYRHYNDIESWSKWIRLATTEQPTKNSLPLASGMSAISADSCYYYKTQNDQVKVVGCIQKSSALTNGNILATLPAGYRPANVEDRVALFVSAHASGLIRVAINGQITVNFSSISGQTQVFFEIEFMAV